MLFGVFCLYATALLLAKELVMLRQNDPFGFHFSNFGCLAHVLGFCASFQLTALEPEICF